MILCWKLTVPFEIPCIKENKLNFLRFYNHNAQQFLRSNVLFLNEWYLRRCLDVMYANEISCPKQKIKIWVTPYFKVLLLTLSNHSYKSNDIWMIKLTHDGCFWQKVLLVFFIGTRLLKINENKIAAKTASNPTRFTRIAKTSNRHVSTTDPQNLDRHN